MEQETLEEFALKTSKYKNHQNINNEKYEAIILGAKWQAKTMYSEEELLEFGKLVLDTFHSEGKTKSGKDRLARVKFNKWFEQFKKK
jgi:hypothetical protein